MFAFQFDAVHVSVHPRNDGKFFQTTKRGEIQESRARKYL